MLAALEKQAQLAMYSAIEQATGSLFRQILVFVCQDVLYRSQQVAKLTATHGNLQRYFKVNADQHLCVQSVVLSAKWKPSLFKKLSQQARRNGTAVRVGYTQSATIRMPELHIVRASV